ncbi:MAG: hypothetical protein U0414_44075, partial [Polyangiaceae bacterium]
MLSSSFGGRNDDYDDCDRRRYRDRHHHHEDNSGPGLGTIVAGGLGVAAVGGLGYMAYKHFAGNNQQQAMMQPG